MQPQQKRNVFALVAGILLIVGFLYPAFNTLRNAFLNVFRYHAPLRVMFSIFLNIVEQLLPILAGVFLLLENRKAASAMKFAYAGVFFIGAARFLINALRFHSLMWMDAAVELLLIAAAVLLAVALLQHGKTGLILAAVAGALVVISLILQLIEYRRFALYYVFRILVAGGYVLAGLYLKDAPPLNAPRAAYAGQGYYPPQPQQGYYPPQQGYYPQRPQQGYYPQQPQQGYYPQPPQQGHYPQQPQQGYYPQPPQPGYYPSQAQPGYYPPQGQPPQPQQRNYPPQQ